MAVFNAFQTLLKYLLRLPRMHLDAADRHPAVWGAILSGTGLGLVWGIAARVWMRLISTRPEFSLPGTIAILVIASVFGTCVGLAFAARRRGWRGWSHYLPRGLVVTFFLPFGIAGGMPLMLTVLLLSLVVTHSVVVGIWVLTVLTMLLVVATDIGIPAMVAILTPVGAVAVTVWKWIVPRWYGGAGMLRVDTWLERIGRTILLLVAAVIFGIVAREIVKGKPGCLPRCISAAILPYSIRCFWHSAWVLNPVYLLNLRLLSNLIRYPTARPRRDVNS